MGSGASTAALHRMHGDLMMAHDDSLNCLLVEWFEKIGISSWRSEELTEICNTFGILTPDLLFCTWQLNHAIFDKIEILPSELHMITHSKEFDRYKQKLNEIQVSSPNQNKDSSAYLLNGANIIENNGSNYLESVLKSITDENELEQDGDEYDNRVDTLVHWNLSISSPQLGYSPDLTTAWCPHRFHGSDTFAAAAMIPAQHLKSYVTMRLEESTLLDMTTRNDNWLSIGVCVFGEMFCESKEQDLDNNYNFSNSAKHISQQNHNIIGRGNQSWGLIDRRDSFSPCEVWSSGRPVPVLLPALLERDEIALYLDITLGFCQLLVNDSLVHTFTGLPVEGAQFMLGAVLPRGHALALLQCSVKEVHTHLLADKIDNHELYDDDNDDYADDDDYDNDEREHLDAAAYDDNDNYNHEHANNNLNGQRNNMELEDDDVYYDSRDGDRHRPADSSHVHAASAARFTEAIQQNQNTEHLIDNDNELFINTGLEITAEAADAPGLQTLQADIDAMTQLTALSASASQPVLTHSEAVLIQDLNERIHHLQQSIMSSIVEATSLTHSLTSVTDALISGPASSTSSSSSMSSASSPNLHHLLSQAAARHNHSFPNNSGFSGNSHVNSIATDMPLPVPTRFPLNRPLLLASTASLAPAVAATATSTTTTSSSALDNVTDLETTELLRGALPALPTDNCHQDTTCTNASNDPNSSEACCCVCIERRKCVVLIPCRHLCVCETCGITNGHLIKTCPICRVTVSQRIKVYL